jgi:hypothetical protein
LKAIEILDQLTDEQLEIISFNPRKWFKKLNAEEISKLKAKRDLIKVILKSYPLRAVGLITGLTQEGVRYHLKKLDSII